MSPRSLLLLAPALVAAAACGSSPADPASTSATVYFVLDAPLCSSQLPVVFEIDRVAVGVDTFRVNLSPDRTRSRAFPVVAGEHTLGARVLNGYVWPEKVVRVSAGAVVNDSLPFYCS